MAIFGAWFLLGRVVFAVTYFVGGLLNMQILRSWGTAINYGAVLLLVEACCCQQGFFLPFIFRN